MSNSRFDNKTLKNKTNKKYFSNFTTLFVLGAVTLAVLGAGFFVSFKSTTNTVLAAKPQSTPKNNKKFVATRKIIVDKVTNELRKPTAEELNSIVVELEKLTKRPTENLQTTELANGGEAVDLADGYAGTIISRPSSDGTLESKCVFSFEEAAEFLGLQEDLTQ